MKVKDLIQQVEYLMGRQPEKYMMQLINDALMDMSGKIQHHTSQKKQNLNQKQRWYALEDNVIDVTRVEILDTDDRYVMIPKLADPHKILKDDSDDSSDSLT
tara:strand:+ start:1170 stop:1475 length:306 start_codon:yes stop_codon:yes gene_type:complete